MKEIMMKRRNSAVLAGLLAVSLCCSSRTIQAKKNDGLVQGVCIAGVALVGIAGAVAFVDWCCSETDDQLITRVNAQYRRIYAQYYDTMTYFGQISGINLFTVSPKKPIHAISESVLHEFATHVWHLNSTQYDYRSHVISAKEQLKSLVQTLRKRVHALEGKSHNYEDQQRLRTMRQLLNDSEELLSSISLFVDCLDHHRTYFNLYDSVDTIRNRHLQEINIFESGRYSIPAELLRYIIGCDNGQYPLRAFVKTIKSDISTLQSDLRSLIYTYPVKRQYVNGLIDCLVGIQNIIMIDSRYQQELYAWEQARLHQLHIDALEAQARAERVRLNAIREHNNLLQERNRIERERLWQGCNNAHIVCNCER